MARIRSLKPEFWTDGKIGRISDNAALLFIGLWTFADDYGYFCCDTRELSLRMPRWRSSSIHHMLCSLVRHGLLRVCTPLAVAQIVGWDHQKIKDRRASKWNDLEIQWDQVLIDAQGSDRKRLGVDRIGEEGSGSERSADASPLPPTKQENKKIFTTQVVNHPDKLSENEDSNRALAKYFSDFCVENFADTGMGMKGIRVAEAFHSVENFAAFVTEIQQRQVYRRLKTQGERKSYFGSAIEKEMQQRGVGWK